MDAAPTAIGRRTNSAAEDWAELMRVRDLPATQRSVIRAWCMYDWANSAFATSGVAAIFPIYFVFLFKEALGEDAAFLGITFTGSSMWSLGVAISTATVAVSSPVLGVISDRVPIKKALLWTYAGAGSVFTGLMFFSAYTSQPWAWMLGMFILANIGFAGSLVFYNSFLPHLAPRTLLDDISSRGFAYGYAGGGLLLLAHLAVILATQDSGIADLATRAAIASVGVWWFGWSIWTLRVMPEPSNHRPVEGLTVLSAFPLGFRELGRTFRELSRFRVALVYLAAYVLFNDGVQTVLAIAGAFAADTIGISLAFNMATIVIIQFVAVPGAHGFGRLAQRISTKRALMTALGGWMVVVLLGIAVVPLSPREHTDFDFQVGYRPATGDYVVNAAPELPDSGFELRLEDERWVLKQGGVLTTEEVRRLPEAVRDTEGIAYSLSVRGGGLDGQSAVGSGHPSALGEGPLDWWPSIVREAIWEPLGLEAGYQWLMLGVSVGVVIGGSQALARSLFAQITPQSRSGEFFSFFGFMSRASSVFGPALYIVSTALFDTRVAVTSILLIIVAGTIVLYWVDVAEGARVAEAEDLRSQSGPPAGDTPPSGAGGDSR
jgi:UMF1 family MFS transporter